jgi:hypothetical protein
MWPVWARLVGFGDEFGECHAEVASDEFELVDVEWRGAA